MRILVGINAKDEEEGLALVLPLIPRHLSGIGSVDVLVIDDGSTDNTADVAYVNDCRVIHHHQSCGYGYGRKESLRHAIADGYDVIVTMDGDGQHQPGHVESLVRKLLQDNQVVRASRFHPDIKDSHGPPPEWLRLNREVTNAVNELTGWNLTDALCGMMAFPIFVAERILPHLQCDDYGYANEALFHMSHIVDRGRVAEVLHIPVYDLTEKMRDFYTGDLEDRKRRYYLHLQHIEELQLNHRDVTPHIPELAPVFA